MKDASEITILVVEDDIPMRELVKKILEKHEYRVVEAGDGEEALACLNDLPEIALIITDIRMPRKTGMTLLKDVVNTRPEVRVILITGFGEVEEYLDAMNIGAFEYLNKPFKNQQLLDVVKRALASKINA